MSIAQEYKIVNPHRRRICPNGCIEIGRNRGCAIENKDGSVKCFDCRVYWPAWSMGSSYPNARYVKGHVLDLQERMARCWDGMQPGEYVLIKELVHERNTKFQQERGGSYYGILGIPEMLVENSFSIKKHKVTVDGTRITRKVAYRSLGPKRSLTVSVPIPLTDSLSLYGNTGSGHLVEKSLLPANIQRLETAYLEDQLSRKKHNDYASAVFVYGRRQWKLHKPDGNRAFEFKNHLRIWDVKYVKKSEWLNHLTSWVDHGINCWCHIPRYTVTDEYWNNFMEAL